MTRLFSVCKGIIVFGLLLLLPCITFCAALWMPVGPYGGFMECLGQAPEDPNVLFTSVSPQLFKSVDGGESWELVKLPDKVGVDCVAVAGAGEEVAAGTARRGLLFVSRDGGDRWERVQEDSLGNIYWLSFIDDTQNGRRLLACTSAGLFVSTDCVSDWEKIGGGLPDGTGFSYFSSSDPGKSCYMFLCGKEIGLYRSEQLESGWERVQVTQLEGQIKRAVVQWDNRDNVFACGPAGVHHSTDGGDSWQKVWTLPTDKIATSRSQPDTLYAAGQFGVVMTADSGATWLQRNQGVLIGNYVTGDLCVSQSSTLDIWLASLYGVYRTTDGGEGWHPCNNGISGLSVTSTAVSSRVPGLVLTTALGNLFRKTEGEDWQLLGVAQTTTAINAEWATLDPCDDSAVYIWDTRGGSKLKRSENTGDEPWETLLEPGCGASGLAIDYETGENLYIGTRTRGVMVSRDRGATWAESNEGLPEESRYVNIIEIAPSDGDVLWVVLGKDIYRSADGGRSWSFVRNIQEGVNSITIDPENSDRVYIGTFMGEGVWLATLGGSVFTALGAGLLDKVVNDIAIDPNDSSLIYAGTGALGVTSFYAGLYQLNVTGTGWERIECPKMEQTSLFQIAVDPWELNRVLCAFAGSSLYSYTKTIGPPINVSLATDYGSYTAGESQNAFISVTNTGDDLDVELYIAILLPDGRVLFWPNFWYDMTPCFSLAPMPQGFTLQDFCFYTVMLPGSLTPGDYAWYAVFYAAGSSEAMSNLASTRWSFGEM
ncbi:MAG: hypothetical protein JW941_01170 [Candidatus Coatesbacteria bacterium]|nr:hypothetical protein [Candidatus Coatesbacteria bacterium]